jgi:Ca2+:H+ antiporter
LVSSIEGFAAQWNLGKPFVGLILLPYAFFSFDVLRNFQSPPFISNRRGFQPPAEFLTDPFLASCRIVGNAAEHVSAVTFACKNKMDLSIGIALGSSMQIALLVTPLLVVVSWISNTTPGLSLLFNTFETSILFISVLIVNYLILDGRSNWLEGSMLLAVRVDCKI